MHVDPRFKPACSRASLQQRALQDFPWVCLEDLRQHFFDGLDGNDVQLLLHFVGHVFKVLYVLLWNEDCLHTSANCSHQFFWKSTDWHDIEIDLRRLTPFEWYSNSDDVNHCEAVTRISFGISDGSAVAGTFYLDDISLSGDIFPAPDFMETVIVRKENGFSESASDGTVVYRGMAENFTDTSADTGRRYWYSAFASDDRGNISAPAASAQWCTDEPYSALESSGSLTAGARKTIKDGMLLITLPDGRCYNAMGCERSHEE